MTESLTHSPKMIGPDEALERVLRETPRLEPRLVSRIESRGLRLAEPVIADRDYPPFPRAMMDGFAVRVGDAGRTIAITGEVAAGQFVDGEVSEGACIEVMTGAPCPAGTEAVVPKEEVERESMRVLLPQRIRNGQFICPQGSECSAGAVVLRPGELITPLAIAVLASFGIDRVRVVPRPTMSIITTGGELVAPGKAMRPGQIRDSNGPMLAAMALDLGVELPVCLHADDRLDAILDALRSAAQTDIVLLTGGVSVGAYDLVPRALREFGAELVFHRVTQRPGKPLLFARKGKQCFFGLPGNPLSCHVGFHRYVSSAVLHMEGKPASATSRVGRLTVPLASKGDRTYYVTARAERSETSDEWLVTALPGVTSADIFAACRANCYVEVPPGEELRPGDTIAFAWISGVP